MLIYAGQPGRNDWAYRVNPMFIDLPAGKDYAGGLSTGIGSHGEDAEVKVYFVNYLTLAPAGYDISIGSSKNTNRQIVGNSDIITEFSFYKWAIGHTTTGSDSGIGSLFGKSHNYEIFYNDEGIIKKLSWGDDGIYPFTSIYKKKSTGKWMYESIATSMLSLVNIEETDVSQDFSDVIFDFKVYDESDAGYKAMVDYLLSEDPYIVKPDIPGGNTKPSADPYSGTTGGPSKPNNTPSANTPGRSDIPIGVPDDYDRPNLFHQIINTGFVSLYAPTDAQIRALATAMWTDDFFETIIKNFSDPMDAVLSLGLVPFSVAGVSEVVKIGNWKADGTLGRARIEMPKVQNQYKSIDLGTVFLSEAIGAYLDYSPYSRVHLYLPYIGTVPLNTDDVMGKNVGVTYVVDLFTGSCVAYISVNGSVHSQYSGNCLTVFPISGRDMSSLYQAAISVGLSAVTSLMPGAGGVASALKGGAMAATANTVMNAKDHVTMGGSIQGSAGVLGPQFAYLLIESPNLCLPNYQNHFIGYPSFITRTLSSLSGYTEVESIHLEGVPCTEEELKEIEQLLKGGVML